MFDRSMTVLVCVPTVLAVVAAGWLWAHDISTKAQRSNLRQELVFKPPSTFELRDKEFVPTGFVLADGWTERRWAWAWMGIGFLASTAALGLAKWIESLWPVTKLYVPALEALLRAAEDRKGSPLTEDEVRRIQQGAVCRTVPVDCAEAYGTRHLSPDLGPDDCWAAWQRVRDELAREEAERRAPAAPRANDTEPAAE